MQVKCLNCEKMINTYPSRQAKFCSLRCKYEHMSFKAPPREQLEELYLKKHLSLEKIAHLFNVSLTPVYKWFHLYNIPIFRRRSINSYENYSSSKLTDHNLSEYEIGYICGFIDGEGAIGINKQISKKGNLRLQPYIKISNTNSEAMKYLQSLINGKLSFRKNKNLSRKDFCNLQISNTKLILDTLLAIYNKLLIKRKQAEIVIEFCKNRLKGANERTFGITKRELELYENIKEFNTKGKRSSANIF
jgi:hypothetical protein